MQAYSSTNLCNRYAHEQASEAFHKQGISAETYEKIVEAHPVSLYTPNYFIRIALALLTILAVLFSMLLLWLISGTSSDGAFIVLFVICALLCYASLELFVRSKQYYNAGIDNILMLSVITCLLTAVLINDHTNSYIITSGCMVLLCLWLCIRFTDAFMTILSYCALMAFLFFISMKMGDTGKAIIPFVLMITSVVVYFIMKKLLNEQRLLFYHSCCRWVLFFTLLTFYASGSYFVVTELSNRLLPSPATGNTIPLGWFFWIFTMIVPPFYLIWGILKKDLLFIRTGLGLLAATIFTIRQYYTFWPWEIEMLVIGTMIIAACYVLIKYLHTPKHGFSFEKDSYNEKQLRHAEALIIAQTFGKKTGESKSLEFGGGSSGGGGATGNY